MILYELTWIVLYQNSVYCDSFGYAQNIRQKMADRTDLIDYDLQKDLTLNKKLISKYQKLMQNHNIIEEMSRSLKQIKDMSGDIEEGFEESSDEFVQEEDEEIEDEEIEEEEVGDEEIEDEGHSESDEEIEAEPESN